MKSQWREHDTDPDGIYIYDSPSLIADQHRDVWLEEATDAVKFTCSSCHQTSIDLRSLDLLGKINPRTSVRNGGLVYIRNFRPWTIQCQKCDGIYLLTNGWIEPNNGRMLSVLYDIHRLRKLETIEDALIMPVSHIPADIHKRVGYHQRRYWDVFFRTPDLEIRFTVESILGRFHKQTGHCYEILFSGLPYESPFGQRTVTSPQHSLHPTAAAQSHTSDLPATYLRSVCAQALQNVIARMKHDGILLINSTAVYLSGIRVTHDFTIAPRTISSPQIEQAIEALLWSIFIDEELSEVPGLMVKDLLV